MTIDKNGNQVNVTKGVQGFHPVKKGEPTTGSLTSAGGFSRSIVPAVEVARSETGDFAEVVATHQVDGRNFLVHRFFTVNDEDPQNIEVDAHLGWGFEDDLKDENVIVESSFVYESVPEAMEAKRKMASSETAASLAVQDWMLED